MKNQISTANAEMLNALRAGFTATSRKGRGTRKLVNPCWLYVETFRGTLRASFRKMRPFVSRLGMRGKNVQYGLSREGYSTTRTIA
jgi:hypothetical protein